MEQHNPAVSSECESLESSNMNIDACTSQSMNIYIQEGASTDLDAERRDSETEANTEHPEHLKNEIRILTNKVKLLQSKLSKHREDKKKITRLKRRLGKSFCTVIDLWSQFITVRVTQAWPVNLSNKIYMGLS